MRLLKIITAAVIVCFLLIMSFVLFSFKPDYKPSITISITYDTTAFATSKDTIAYKKNIALVWDDFKGAPKPNMDIVANSAVGYKFDAGIRNQNNKVTINVRIASFFVKNKSWGVQKNKTPYILVHEQNHFALARYGAELFKRYITEQKITEKNVSSCIDKAYQKSWNEYLQLQAQYDKETNHSINKAEQERWNKKIEALLLQCM